MTKQTTNTAEVTAGQTFHLADGRHVDVVRIYVRYNRVMGVYEPMVDLIVSDVPMEDLDLAQSVGYTDDGRFTETLLWSAFESYVLPLVLQS